MWHDFRSFVADVIGAYPHSQFSSHFNKIKNILIPVILWQMLESEGIYGNKISMAFILLTIVPMLVKISLVLTKLYVCFTWI